MTDRDSAVVDLALVEVRALLGRLESLLRRLSEEPRPLPTDSESVLLEEFGAALHQLRGIASLAGLALEPAASRLREAVLAAAAESSDTGRRIQALRAGVADIAALVRGAAGRSPRAAAGSAERVPDGGAVVLYVEDSPSNRLVVERTLGRCGVEVAMAATGTDGVRLAREIHPAVILLDLHLPDMSGEAVLAALRTDDRTVGIPVVVVSGEAMADDVARVRAAGAEEYLTKPIDLAALKVTVERLIAARGVVAR